jgi:endo-1,4-beta-xylanase
MWAQATGKAAGQTAQQHPAGAPDEMTANTMQQQQHFPPPDFGPLPSELPAEAKAVAGKNSLNHHAIKHGLIAGTAVVIRALQRDPVLQQLIADQYGIVVSENELKWVALRPGPKDFDFAPGDAFVDFATKHKLLIRGHNFVWHNSVPAWLLRDPGKYDVRQLLVDHIQTVGARYRGKIHSWDVVNEAILPKDGREDGLRKSFWFEHIGPDYIDLAFRTAREADPHAKLTYNDYGVEYDNVDETERRKQILALLRRMQQNKVPLDAVGIQAHIKAAATSTIGKGLSEFIEAIHQMGLEVYLTEMDVNEDDIASNDVATRDHEIAQTYRHFLDVALADPAVKLVLTWGTSDRSTWLNGGPTHHRKQPNRPQRSLPFDPAYRPTEAFFAMRDSFDTRGKVHGA